MSEFKNCKKALKRVTNAVIGDEKLLEDVRIISDYVHEQYGQRVTVYVTSNEPCQEDRLEVTRLRSALHDAKSELGKVQVQLESERKNAKAVRRECQRLTEILSACPEGVDLQKLFVKDECVVSIMALLIHHFPDMQDQINVLLHLLMADIAAWVCDDDDDESFEINALGSRIGRECAEFCAAHWRDN